MWPQPPGYVWTLREICRRNGILFIADEVATGFGRTGKMFACEHEDVVPDILCLGKGITGGYLALAATLTGYIVTMSGWTSAFFVLAGLSLIAAAIFTRIDASQRVYRIDATGA